MSTIWAVRPLAVLLTALLLIVAAMQLPQFAATAATPPAEPQGQSFSVSRSSPLTSSGVNPADILGVGGSPIIGCASLGLLCDDPASSAKDELNGLSYGWDFVFLGLPPLQFSVAPGSQGAAGSAVRVEARCTPAEPQADVFQSSGSTNIQNLDGNGVACGSNSGLGLDLAEGASSNNLSNLDRDPCLFVDLNCDGNPEDPVFFTLAPRSPSLAMVGATPVDILVSVGGVAPTIWASGTADLGLQAGDAIDALCLREDGSGIYDSGDELLFSLAPSSPTLTAMKVSPADLLRPGPLTVIYSASMLGLQATDNVDALICSYTSSRLFIPRIMR
jgi:hypothetical protein